MIAIPRGPQVTRQAALAEEERNKVWAFGLIGNNFPFCGVFFFSNPWNLFNGNVTLLNGRMEPIVDI